MTDNPKQVIVMRNDLNMRKGKMVAQGAHASLGAVLLIMADSELCEMSYGRAGGDYSAEVHLAAESWLKGAFKKICVYVNSETELDDIWHQADKAKLPVKMITDSGLTEFNNVPTKTCLAIGPCWSADIDKITGKLPLL